ncbi:type I restriction-modification system subunit M N-terminal domain-containing protein [Archangium violaceum]|nr:type I restriction-modification system subunit M N-terminal domain-containing protein [Archangium violaceum]
MQLGRARLNELTQQYALDVADRRVPEHHAEALVSAKSVDFAELLGGLKREELQSICDALRLDRGGREKGVLVQRILGAGDGGAEPAPAAPKKRPARESAPPEQTSLDLPSTARLTVDQLERYLWSAADILRGSIDSSDYKNYIFGLLFLKRLSDVFEEEAQKLLDQGEPEDVAWEDHDSHRFFVPKRARWSEIQKVSTNIGEALNKACAALEEQNSSLDGILAGIDFNDERKLGDGKNRDTVLSKLVQHFAKLNLRNAALSEPDMLGRAYEYLGEAVPVGSPSWRYGPRGAARSRPAPGRHPRGTHERSTGRGYPGGVRRLVPGTRPRAPDRTNHLVGSKGGPTGAPGARPRAGAALGELQCRGGALQLAHHPGTDAARGLRGGP